MTSATRSAVSGEVRLGERQLVGGHQHGRADRRPDPLPGLQGAAGRPAHAGRHVGEGEGEVRRDHAATAQAGDEQGGTRTPTSAASVRPGASTAVAATPVIITARATTVSRRPTRLITRPARGAVTAEPTANGVSSRPAVQRREPAPLLEEDREHEEDAGEPGEVDGADGEAAGVPGRARSSPTSSSGAPAARHHPPLPAHEAPAAPGAASQQAAAGRRSPPSSRTTGSEHAQHGEPEQEAARDVDARVGVALRVAAAGHHPRDRDQRRPARSAR